ncbi:MAG: hypothetical protein H7039_09495, partial [Bryobacteraceae bacterium]|nr:hypothetical protein [Bryobacteraceae bacterium]
TVTFTLTARNALGESSANATITVAPRTAAQFLTGSITPTTITAGQPATINYSTSNADSVTISPGIGTVELSGLRVVTPAQTTTYVLTATSAGGPATCNLTVTVNPAGTAPRIIAFTGTPSTITAGQSSTLTWNVENAESVNISGLGEVPAQGTRSVSPATTTTYTLSARNQSGTSQATAVITVNPSVAPVIGGCAATPATLTSSGGAVTINYFTQNADRVTFSPAVPSAGLNGPVTVNPTATTIYTLTATGSGDRTATCTVTVTVTPAPPPPTAVIVGPSTIQTIQRQTTLDASQSTNPAGGALTYIWTPLGTGAAVLDQGQPVTRVQFSGQFGDYIFRLTVRNSVGQEASTTVTVRFISSQVP